MPTYQYACTECGHQLEAVQKFTDDPLTVCPQCEGRLRKLFNSVGIVFKGSGFYRTDSRSAGVDASTKKSDAASSAPAASDSSTAASGSSSAGGSSTSTSSSPPASGGSSSTASGSTSSSSSGSSTTKAASA